MTHPIYRFGEILRELRKDAGLTILVEVHPFVDEQIEPVGVLRVETENSIWFVTSERYQRLPRAERPRRSQLSIARRLDDGRWHGLRRCWWRVHDDGARQLRLLPDVGPADGHGIVTGVVLTVSGSWMPADADADDSSLGAGA